MDYQSLLKAIGTDVEVARVLKIDRSTASRLRRGVTRPSFKTLRALLKVQAKALRQ